MGTKSEISKFGVSATTTRSLFGVRLSLVKEIRMMRDDWKRAIRYGEHYPSEEIDIKERLLDKIDAKRDMGRTYATSILLLATICTACNSSPYRSGYVEGKHIRME